MAALKFGLMPQPVPAAAESDVTATTSHSRIKSQFWFESAVTHLTQGLSRQLADILVALLTPAAVVAMVLGLWRVGADLGWANSFPIEGGLFSHWQIWMALSASVKMLSSLLIAWGSRTGKFSEEN